MKVFLITFFSFFLGGAAAVRAADRPIPPILQMLESLHEQESPPPTLTCPNDGKLCMFPYRFSTEVSDETIVPFMKFLTAAQQAGAKAVMLELNTPGGSPDAGHEMVRAMEMSPLRIVCVVDGMAASTGMYILQSCDVRYITKRSNLLTHNVRLMHREGTGTEVVTIDTAHQMVEELDALNASFAEQIIHRAKNIGMKEYHDRVAHGDWIMGWEEALHFGFVDQVWDGIPNRLFTQLRDTGKLP